MAVIGGCSLRRMMGGFIIMQDYHRQRPDSNGQHPTALEST